MRRQDGFTLIELLIVMVVIAALAAIALPMFTSQRGKAQDADAKSNAANIHVHVESCAVNGENTYADCATAAQIEAADLPVGMLRLPPLGQFAAAGGNGGSNNGIKNGAQCIEQSNGARACEQTGSGSDSGSNTTVGGSAPDVGDCVEGGAVEPGCVGIVSTSSGYTITSVSKSTHVFKIVNANGTVTQPCTPPGQGGCPDSGTW